MTNILTISNSASFLAEIQGILNEYSLKNTVLEYAEEQAAIDFVKNGNFNIVLVDDKIENFDVLTKKIKTGQSEGVFVALFYDLEIIQNKDFTGFIDSFIQKPVNKNILISTINSVVKLHKSIEKFKLDNKELNKSLYQLDVLYNTSSKLSGNLDKEKLNAIMFETLEKTLSYDLACALLYNKPKNKLIVHTLKKLEPNFASVLKEKIILYAKDNLGQNADFTDIEIEEHVKPSYDNQMFDLKILNHDRLEAPIKVKDNTFGVVVLFRSQPFTKEDVVCFQSVVHQIASPLRTIILYNEIKNTNIELKKLERIKSEFVSIVSHELRTPLTPINNSLEIVLSEQTGKLTEPAKNFINMAKRNVSRLSGIIEDLLDLSRMQAGKFDFKYKVYNVKNSLDLIQKTFETQAQDKGLEFKVNMPETLPEIYADSHRIEQILSNLVTNALKFTPKGGIEVSAKIINSSEVNPENLISPIRPLWGEYINITVKDTGLGIKQEDIGKIFDKFSQIENSLTRNAGGVGLGLTITKHFVDAHLGAIWVESEEEKGSSFNVLIPVQSKEMAFEIDLNSAKKKCETVDVLKISAQKNLENFIEEIKKENILKTSKNSEEIFKKDGNIYEIFFTDVQKSAFNFMINRIKDFTNSPEYGECGIVLESEFYKKEEENKEEI